ncbi:outer membrane receptor protein involved in Fe transport [Altererythrobacter atlanticus]|uniref:Pesticin receptor n=1 Tax=Croceibacterium atlanticum TaxID=1267766 RepID=A0A0F7KUD4_9SPHN|nr:TonB-dependent receptor [Croceibacterium atlanticum]AKH43948.1 Pesticin receptor precursor [Croceibacterium atlanticum]MBB5733602.1 outer membrane receptor protein involved in Fe transport [Croceibacterium atlanticum]
MNTKTMRTCCSAIAIGIATVGASHAAAQTAESTEARTAASVAEIVVTAQRREQRQQDVPISISVVDGAQISRDNLADLSAVADRQANVQITPGPFDQLNIRGIGSSNNTGFEQSVATFVDGVYRSRPRAIRAALFDVERVEILKGPQTTFFGNNAIAGALNIETRKPGNDFEINGTALYGTFDEYNLEAGVTVPVSDMLSLRVAGRLSGIDGYVDNEFTNDDAPRERTRVGRASVAFTPTPGFRSDLRVDVGDISSDDFLPFEMENCPPDAPFTPGPTCASYLAANGGEIDDTLNWRNNSPPGNLDYSFTEVGWTNSIDIGALTLNAITGYFDHHTEYLQQLVPSPVPGIGGGGQLPVFQRETFRQWSQELRLESPTGGFLEWQIGAFYSDTKLRNNGLTGFYFAPFGASAPPFTADSPVSGRVTVNEDSETKSVFGAATLNPTDRLKLNLGLRYSEVEKHGFRSLVYGVADATYPTPESFVPGSEEVSETLNAILGSSNTNFANPDRTDDKLMPSIGLQFEATPDLTAYATYSKGFKAGGFSGGSTGGDFGPETVDAYEVGIKGSLFDRSVTFALSAFRGDYSGLQESVSETLPSGSVRVSVANAASARSQGLEFSTSWRVTDWLTASTDIAYLDAVYRDYDAAPCSSIQTILGEEAGCIDRRQDLSGKRRGFAPEWSGNLRLDATIPAGNLQVRVTPLMYFTSWFYQSSTADDLIRQEGYAKFDLRLGVGPQDGIWEVALIGKNLTDKATAGFRQTVSGANGSVSALADRPRTVALQVMFRY